MKNRIGASERVEQGLFPMESFTHVPIRGEISAKCWKHSWNSVRTKIYRSTHMPT